MSSLSLLYQFPSWCVYAYICCLSDCFTHYYSIDSIYQTQSRLLVVDVLIDCWAIKEDYYVGFKELLQRTVYTTIYEWLLSNMSKFIKTCILSCTLFYHDDNQERTAKGTRRTNLTIVDFCRIWGGTSLKRSVIGSWAPNKALQSDQFVLSMQKWQLD